MCKLCNTDSISVKIRHNCIGDSFLYEFKKIVFDYTGEHPCNKCLAALSGKKIIVDGGGIDSYIISKLFRKYGHIQYNRKMVDSKRRVLFCTKQKEIEQTIAENIRARVRESGNTSFIVSIMKNKKKYKKSFSTVYEAVEYRNKIKGYINARTNTKD